jgi:hypothetical protein
VRFYGEHVGNLDGTWWEHIGNQGKILFFSLTCLVLGDFQKSFSAKWTMSTVSMFKNVSRKGFFFFFFLVLGNEPIKELYHQKTKKYQSCPPLN